MDQEDEKHNSIPVNRLVFGLLSQVFTCFEVRWSKILYETQVEETQKDHLPIDEYLAHFVWIWFFGDSEAQTYSFFSLPVGSYKSQRAFWNFRLDLMQLSGIIPRLDDLKAFGF